MDARFARVTTYSTERPIADCGDNNYVFLVSATVKVIAIVKLTNIDDAAAAASGNNNNV